MCTDPRLSGMALRAHSNCVHDPQSRLSRRLRPQLARAAGDSRGELQYRRRGILQSPVLHQGRPGLRFPPDDRQSDLCPRDHHGRVRLRSRRAVAATGRSQPAFGHFKRNRRELGSAHLLLAVQPFGAGDWAERSLNADDVREQFGLAVSRGPLFALVARLVHQKGVDLVIESAQTIVDAGGQIVVTGKGEARFEEALLQAQARAPQSIAVKIGFDDAEARKIFAGSDFTLMPSRFEPCGLSQMYAQRFGSLPIGHRTGGLAETIVDAETGFLFDRASAPGFLGSLCRAFSTFGMKDRLDHMRRAAMAQAFSWTQSAKSYAAIYKSSI